MRGFVNQSLVTQNFVKNSLKAKPKPMQKDSGDEKMILPAIPVCGAK